MRASRPIPNTARELTMKIRMRVVVSILLLTVTVSGFGFARTPVLGTDLVATHALRLMAARTPQTNRSGFFRKPGSLTYHHRVA